MNYDIVAIITSILALISSIGTMILAFKKWRPEVKKLFAEGEKVEAETNTELVSAANMNLSGAELSIKMLMSRIQELREDLESEKRARREDAEYFRRRFRDAEREARDYRDWAARLAKQVIELGKVPVDFVPSLHVDSDKFQAIMPEKSEERKDT